MDTQVQEAFRSLNKHELGKNKLEKNLSKTYYSYIVKSIEKRVLKAVREKC